MCVTVPSSTQDGHVWVSYTMLKIPTRLSEAVNRRTDNTMVKSKGQKRTNSDLQTLHGKLKIHQHKPQKNESELAYLELVLYINFGISCLSSAILFRSYYLFIGC